MRDDRIHVPSIQGTTSARTLELIIGGLLYSIFSLPFQRLCWCSNVMFLALLVLLPLWCLVSVATSATSIVCR